MFKATAEQLLGSRRSRYPLEVLTLPIIDLEIPTLLRFSIASEEGAPLALLVAPGDSVEAGGLLAGELEGAFIASPVRGSVTGVTSGPEIRGLQETSVVIVEPADGLPQAPFSSLDPETASIESLVGRLREAGVSSGSIRLSPLAKSLQLTEGNGVDQLVVLAADREPGICASAQLFRERANDVEAAAKLLGRVTSAGRIVLAVLEDMLPEATEVCRTGPMEILPIPAEYPESLEPLVALRAGAEGVTRVVTLEAALAALDAVREGRVPQSKVLTVIGREGKPVANYRVPLGTRIKEVLTAAGIETREKDKVLAGGPMRGFAQYSLSGAVDAGVDAITVIPAEDVVPWSEEPCINCGLCIEACPTNLQVQLISRYAEFELFDRTVELEIDQCIECGLCASVCTGRRPLVQLIRLAKREVEASA